jgi:flagellar protein FliL
MSTPEIIPAPEEHKPSQPKASKATLLLGLLSVLNLGATGFVAANVAFGYTEEEAGEEVAAEEHAEAPAEGGHGESKGGHGGGEEHAEEKGEDGGPIVPLDPFVVNLNEPGSSRYLKATFEIEMMNARSASELKASKRSVRDEIFRYLSSLSVSDTLGEQSKARIQREVFSRIEREVGRGEVKKLFFTEFVVQ